jgi:hypothetical protein
LSGGFAHNAATPQPFSNLIRQPFQIASGAANRLPASLARRASRAAGNRRGLGVATSAANGSGSECRVVRTEWIPRVAVEKVAPGGLELSIDALGAAADSSALRAKLAALPEEYGAWIDKQRALIPSDERGKQVGEYLASHANFAKKRVAGTARTLPVSIAPLRHPTAIH